MAEEVNKGNSDFSSNSAIIGKSKTRDNFISILITLSLIVGPILLPLILIKPNWFSDIPYMVEISISVTILFIFTSSIVAYYRDKKTENETS